mgnify:CR=1 FL=1
MERNTKQKQVVMHALESLCHPSAQEIYDFAKKYQPNISMGTVYRILGIFEEQNKVLHIKIPNKADCYDYNSHQHYHLTCKNCKKVYDIPMPYLSELNKKTDEYLIEDHIILFNGVCANCLKNKEGK